MKPDDRQPLTDRQRGDWVKQTADYIKLKWASKFMKGMIQHKGDLGSLTVDQLLDEIEQEALDTLSYVREIRRRNDVERHR